MTRVLHVLEAVAHGTGRHLLDLVRFVSDVTHEVVLPEQPTPRGERDPHATAVAAREAGAHVHLVPLRRNPAHPDLARAVVAVRRLLRGRAPDVVHGHATVGGAVARLAAAGSSVPCIYTPNGLHPSRIVRMAERALAPLTARFVAVSEGEAVLARRLHLADPRRIRVVPNGIDVDVQPPAPLDVREMCGLEPGTPVVGFVGRLADQKGPTVLVAAAAHLDPDIHVIFVGDGPAYGQVTRLVHQFGLRDRVHLLGHVDGAAGLLPQFDAVALPSRWEGAPYVPLEAFRAGTPVVVTDSVGNRDVVRHGVTGLVVPVDAPAALAAALERVLDDPGFAASLSSAARHDLPDRFDVRRMAERVRRVYAEVAK